MQRAELRQLMVYICHTHLCIFLFLNYYTGKPGEDGGAHSRILSNPTRVSAFRSLKNHPSQIKSSRTPLPRRVYPRILYHFPVSRVSSTFANSAFSLCVYNHITFLAPPGLDDSHLFVGATYAHPTYALLPNISLPISLLGKLRWA